MVRKDSKKKKKKIKKCPDGYIKRNAHSRKRYSRKAHTKTIDGEEIKVKGSVVKPTRVRATCVPDKGLPGKGSERGVPKIKITEKGLLSTEGYKISSGTATRRKAINKSFKRLVDKYADKRLSARKILRHLVLLRTYRKHAQSRVEKEYHKRLDEDIKYVRRKWFKHRLNKN